MRFKCEWGKKSMMIDDITELNFIYMQKIFLYEQYM